jgi:RNA polymerase sigma-70 factor (ECF subfamily)
MHNHIDYIYRNYHKLLMAFIIRRVKNRFIAEDILQDVFIKVLHNIKTLKDTEKIKNWLFQITRNSIIDYYRNVKESVESTERVLNTNDHHEDEVSKKLQLSVLSMIQQLPFKYRQALFLADYKGLAQKEIAYKLNVSLTCVKSRVQRARRMMKEIYLKCCHFEFDRNGKVIDYYNR